VRRNLSALTGRISFLRQGKRKRENDRNSKTKALGLQTLKQVCSFMHVPWRVLLLHSRICNFRTQGVGIFVGFKLKETCCFKAN